MRCPSCTAENVVTRRFCARAEHVAHTPARTVVSRTSLSAGSAVVAASRSRSCRSGAGNLVAGTSHRWRGAAAADGDVLRSGRLDGAVGAARPGGSARGDRRLSPLRCQGDRARRRVCRQVHGRRGAGLFRLSAGRRARCRARGARGTEAGREGGRARHRRGGAIAGAGRHRHRAGGRRRSDRPGRVAGTGGGRRDAEPRGAAAGAGRAGRPW